MVRFKNRKGASLITVISIFFVLSMVGVIVTNILTVNILASRHQREVTQAYYLALAGTEIGTSALLRRALDDSFPVLDFYRTYTGNFGTLGCTNHPTLGWAFTEVVRFGPNISGLPAANAGLGDYNASKIEIWIRPVTQNGIRITNTGPQNQGSVWVEVLARSTFYNSAQLAALQADPSLDGTIGTRHALSVRFNAQEPEFSIRNVVNPNSF